MNSTSTTFEEDMNTIKLGIFNQISDGFHNKFVCCPADANVYDGGDDTLQSSQASEQGEFAFALSAEPQDTEDTSGSDIQCEKIDNVEDDEVKCLPFIGHLNLYTNETSQSADVLDAIEEVVSSGNVPDTASILNVTYVGKRSSDTVNQGGSCGSSCYFNQLRGILSDIEVSVSPMGIFCITMASLLLVGVIFACRRRIRRQKEAQNLVLVEPGDTDLGLSKDHSYSDDGAILTLQNSTNVLDDDDLQNVEMELAYTKKNGKK